MCSQRTRRETRLYVAGEWRGGASTMSVTDLATGGQLADVATADESIVDDALTVAEETEPALAAASIPERVEWVSEIAAGLADRRADLAETIAREAGKPIVSARSEVDSAVERFERASEEIRALFGEYREGTTASHDGWRAIVAHEPVGTVLCVAPFNYPLATLALQVAPALAVGNAVVVKPSSRTPLSALGLARAVEESPVPDGALHVLPGRSSQIGDALAGDERVETIAMTGSTRAGKAVADEAGLTTLHMELGGNAPAIVFEDADLDAVAADVASGALSFAGQRCSAVSRVLVVEQVRDELVDRIDAAVHGWTVGDPLDDETDLGPLISGSQARFVQELVDDAVSRGAHIRCGGTYTEDPEGVFYYEPTFIADVPRDARLVREEQFGPVLPVSTVDSVADAVALCNDGDLALDASVYTADYDRALSVADRVDAGTVRINGAPSHGIGDVPFGGNENSGIGREGLYTAIEDYVRRKSIIL